MTATQNYFDTEAQALDIAIARAIEQGAEFDTQELERFIFEFGPVNYGTTVRGTLPTFRFKGKLTRNRVLTVVLCRMESGKYELTSYLS